MREILYTDKAGNKLIVDHDGKMAGINRAGRIVNTTGLHKLMKEAGYTIHEMSWRSKTRGNSVVSGGPKRANSMNSFWWG